MNNPEPSTKLKLIISGMVSFGFACLTLFIPASADHKPALTGATADAAGNSKSAAQSSQPAGSTAMIENPLVFPPKTALSPQRKMAIAYLKQAQFLFLNQKITACSEAARKSIELDPNIAYAHFMRGVCLVASERLNEGMKELNIYLANSKSPVPAAYQARAKCYCSLGRFKDALPDLNKWAEIDPKNEYAFSERAKAYYELNDLDRAIADTKRVLLIAPNGGNYGLQGRVYMKAGKYQEALESWNKAIAKDPERALAYSQRANCYLKLGKRDLAAKDKQKAEELVRRDMMP